MEGIADKITSGLMVLDEELTVHHWNRWLATHTAVPADQAVGKKLTDLFPEIAEAPLLRRLRTTIKLGTPTFYEPACGYLIPVSNRQFSGSAFDYMQQNVKILFADNGLPQAVLIVNDQTAIKEAHAETKRLKDKATAYLEMIDRHVITLTTDRDGVITDASQALCRLNGYEKRELIGQHSRILRHPETDPSVYPSLWNALSQGKTWQGEFQNRRKDGTTYWVHSTIFPLDEEEEPRFQALMEDITDKKRVEALMVTDPLTGAYNRRKFNEIFEHEMAITLRYGDPLTMILVDLDHFKKINDTRGHTAGDQVLVETSGLIREHLRQSDTFARWGGEEFVVLLSHTEYTEGEAIAEKLRQMIREHPYPGGMQVTASLGVAQYGPEQTAEAFFNQCDRALYQAKEGGRDKVVVALPD